MSEDKGRPVKPHRSGGGMPSRTLGDVIAAVPLPNYTQPEKPRCAVRGMKFPGTMCGAVIVGGEFCGYAGECQHKVTANAEVTRPAACGRSGEPKASEG